MIILKDKYEVSQSDLFEFIFLPKGIKGKFKHGNLYFNHILFNGKLITEEDEIIKLL